MKMHIRVLNDIRSKIEENVQRFLANFYKMENDSSRPWE
jgi:hypothetical protein